MAGAGSARQREQHADGWIARQQSARICTLIENVRQFGIISTVSWRVDRECLWSVDLCRTAAADLLRGRSHFDALGGDAAASDSAY